MESAQPWVEKHRPRTLDEVVQQNEVVNALRSTIETGDLPHLIFYGPPGTGKTSLALVLCRTLFGSSQEQFRKYVKELNASDDRGIDSIRKNVKEFAAISVDKSLKYPYKIIILDEADSMTSAAQSALRRVIEANSSVTRFIIICNYVSKIIDPILSRCAKFRFKQLAKDSIIQRLKSILEAEKINVADENVYETLVAISNGDLRKAITFAQSASATGVVSSEMLINISGMPSDDVIEEYFNTCASKTWGEIEEATADIVYSGYDISQVLERLANIIVNSKSILEIKKPELLLKLSEVDGAILNKADPHIQMLSLSSSIMSAKA